MAIKAVPSFDQTLPEDPQSCLTYLETTQEKLQHMSGLELRMTAISLESGRLQRHNWYNVINWIPLGYWHWYYGRAEGKIVYKTKDILTSIGSTAYKPGTDQPLQEEEVNNLVARINKTHDVVRLADVEFFQDLNTLARQNFKNIDPLPPLVDSFVPKIRFSRSKELTFAMVYLLRRIGRDDLENAGICDKIISIYQEIVERSHRNDRFPKVVLEEAFNGLGDLGYWPRLKEARTYVPFNVVANVVEVIKDWWTAAPVLPTGPVPLVAGTAMMV